MNLGKPIIHLFARIGGHNNNNMETGMKPLKGKKACAS